MAVINAGAPSGAVFEPFTIHREYPASEMEARYGITAEGKRRTHYYVQESVGIATGLLLAALHHARLASFDSHPRSHGILE